MKQITRIPLKNVMLECISLKVHVDYEVSKVKAEIDSKPSMNVNYD